MSVSIIIDSQSGVPIASVRPGARSMTTYPVVQEGVKYGGPQAQ